LYSIYYKKRVKPDGYKIGRKKKLYSLGDKYSVYISLLNVGSLVRGVLRPKDFEFQNEGDPPSRKPCGLLRWFCTYAGLS